MSEQDGNDQDVATPTDAENVGTESADTENAVEGNAVVENANDELMPIEEILAAFSSLDNEYQRAAVDAAIARREEIVPHLIDILERAAKHPAGFYTIDSMAHIYAAFVLAHLKEPSAHTPLIKAFSLPSNEVWNLFDDVTTEYLPIMLFNTSGGSLEQLKAVAHDTTIDMFVRSAAMHAVNFAVVKGAAERDEAITFYRSLLEDRTRAEPDPDIWLSIAMDADGIYPEELIPIFEEMEREGLLDPMVYDLNAVQKTIDEGQEATLQRTAAEVDRYALDNIHDVLPEWVDRGEIAPLALLKARRQRQVAAQQQKKKKAQKKKKRKMARKSRKKNRR